MNENDYEIMQERENKILAFIKSDEYTPMKPNDLAALISVPPEDKESFNALIDELIKKGKIVKTKKGKLMSAVSMNIYAGKFIANARGFGFVETDELERDIFIPRDLVNGALNGDKVVCRITAASQDGKRSEGEILRIIERGKTRIVGEFESVNGFGFVIADDRKITQDVFIPKEATMGAVTGHKVAAEITQFPEGRRGPEGRIVEIIGHKNDPGVDILSIIKDFELPIEFSDEIYAQAESIPNEIAPEDIAGREDFRDVTLVTIDGEDAKDLDDAVSLETLENGNFSLGVHIADVTNYVKENSPMDKEALKRGTSVYLVDRVIPMLPRKLSNGICSLNPNVDRLTLSCIMEINQKGVVVNHRITEGVIHSKRRMTYDSVNKILNGDEQEQNKYPDVTPMLKNMDKLRRILGKKREKRGAIDFDFAEAKVLLDENGRINDIIPRERNDATNLIEEFMLVCNETIAEDFFWRETPFIYRNHENPNEEKIKKLSDFIVNFGYRIKGVKEVRPKDIQRILNSAKGSPEENIISRVVLRSMSQASYMAENVGHFGLAAKYYCHFTSPIRRYPDLQIHRIIKESIRGISDKRMASLDKKMPDIAKQCSIRERTAEEAERETIQVKMVQYMGEHIGEVFEGIISGVTNWGFYVELPNTIEGLVSANNLDDDYYIFDEQSMSLTGKHTGKRYGIGEKVAVECVRADLQTRVIDFIPAEE